MTVSLRQKVAVGAYVMKQRLTGRKRYPLVLMLEPLFRCNLACFGCGKIDYPDAILNKRLSVKECLDAVDECGAPMVAIPGGEPLIHKEIGEIVKGIVARKKFVSLCTNALLLEKKLHLFTRRPICFSRCIWTASSTTTTNRCAWRAATKAVSAIKAAKDKGFTVNVNCTVYDGHPAEDIAKFLDLTQELGVGVSISPGYAYERAPDQEHFLNRRKTKDLFRQVFALGKGKKWNITHSAMFLDFLAGNQDSTARRGACRPATLRLAEALLSARRGLRQNLHRVDGDHRLGCLRHRPLRKVRQLHGALRLRGNRDGSDRAASAGAAMVSWRGIKTEGPMARKSRWRTSARRSTCSTARCSRRCRRSAPTRRARRPRRLPPGPRPPPSLLLISGRPASAA